jgi:hypothetical protein
MISSVMPELSPGVVLTKIPFLTLYAYSASEPKQRAEVELDGK